MLEPICQVKTRSKPKRNERQRGKQLFWLLTGDGHRAQMVILQGGEATAISSVDSNTTKEDMRFPKT